MKEQLISLQTAKLAKEKGLKLNYCRELFYPDPDKEGEYVTNECSHDWESIEDRDWYSRPTQALLQRWLREVHKLIILIDLGPLSEKYSYEVYNYDEVCDIDYVNDTYEEALEKGLVEALKLIQQQ